MVLDIAIAAWWAVMLSLSVACLHAAFAPKRSEQTEGHTFGDCTDEMFEAMREVDAMGLSGEPLLRARLPPRSAERPPVHVVGQLEKFCANHGATYLFMTDEVLMPSGLRIPAERVYLYARLT